MNSMFAMPSAYAMIKGSEEYQSIEGEVTFYDVYGGTIIKVKLSGIPQMIEEKSGGFLGLHIHEGCCCKGNREDAFAQAGSHLNFQKTLHPRHTGDLPPLLVSDGMAYMEVYSGRFYPEEVVGKTIIIHDMPDDFKSQPSGNSGRKIACGEINDA